MRRILPLLILVSFCSLAGLSPVNSFAQVTNTEELNKAQTRAAGTDSNLSQGLKNLLPRAAKDSAVFVFDARSGQQLFDYNASASLKPASVMKVLTSVVALELLGPDFHFSTKVLADRFEKGTVNTLYVRGSGDPGLTIESAWMMARGLKKRGIKNIKKLVIDDSLFSDERDPQGQRAFLTGSSALAFNYNTLSFEVCPTVEGKPALVTVDPFEISVPVSGSIKTIRGAGGSVSVEATSLGASSELGISGYKVGGTIGEKASCATLYRSVEHPELVFGYTFLKILRSLDIDVPSKVNRGAVPLDAPVLYVQESEPLSQLVRDLNHYSNNFIAEQILFALGESEDGRLSRQRGLDRLHKFLNSLGFSSEDFTVVDASGLSHQNRLPARIIGALLKRAVDDEKIRPEFESSLAVGERSGTLRRRNFGAGEVILRGKTGTLDGVSSLAGYVAGNSGRKYGFVILQNNTSSRDRALQFEEQVVSFLAQR